jgi:hypothetical protein
MEQQHPNAPEAVQERWTGGQLSTAAPLLTLPARALLCIAAQAVTALVLSLVLGHTAAWESSAGLWPLYGTAANLLTIWLLAGVLRREGLSLRGLWTADPASRGEELGLAVTAMAVGVVFALVLHWALAALLFESMAEPFRRLTPAGPAWLRWIQAVSFAVTGAFAVYPLTIGYSVPRLATISGIPAAAYVLATLWIAAQNIMLPFVAEWRYLVWRLLLFMPLYLFIAATVRRRPATLRYMMMLYVVLQLLVFVVVEIAGRAALPK